MTNGLVARLAIAALVGLAVGIEREWSGKAIPGPDARFAGVRTFYLIGIAGGIAGWLASRALVLPATALLVGLALLVVLAYWAAARTGGSAVDGTTEVAALLVIALGFLAGVGEQGVAGGIGALVVLALSEKSTIRSIVAGIDAVELRAALQFAVLAVVILPLLPDRAYGPLGGVNPRALWIVVLIFSGLNFAGWAARRAVGASRGYGVTGALGGVISSTAVSLQFSRQSRDSPELSVGLGVGVVAACTVLIPRVIVLSAVLNGAVAMALVPYLIPPFVVGIAWCAWWFVRARHEPRDGEGATSEVGTATSPLRLWSAIRMTLAFQAALMALDYISARFGAGGVLATAAALGLTDVDALTLSMNRLGSSAEAVPLAARAIAVGIAANSLLKLALTVVFGGTHFRRVASLGVAAIFVAAIAALLLRS